MDRQGDVEGGLTVQLIRASDSVVVHTLTGSSVRRGWYYVDYTSPDTTLYKLKINGAVDTERGSFYIDGGAGGLAGGEIFVKLTETAAVGQCGYVCGDDATNTVSLSAVAKPEFPKLTCVHVYKEAGVSGDIVRAMVYGRLSGMAVTYPAGKALVVGKDGTMAYVGSPQYPDDDQPILVVGCGTGELGVARIQVAVNSI